MRAERSLSKGSFRQLVEDPPPRAGQEKAAEREADKGAEPKRKPRRDAAYNLNQRLFDARH